VSFESTRGKAKVTDPLIHENNLAQSEFWNGPTGQRWTESQEMQDAVLQPVTARLIAAAAPRSGERVIDIGCGCGASAIAFAERVKPGGEVLGLDLSRIMLARARERAAGLPIRFELADAAVYDFTPEWADIAASRFGVMFFADPTLAFANLRKGLKRGGRLAFTCFRPAKLNEFMIAPLREAMKHAPPLPEIEPEAPGPFAFADAARVRRILEAAGYAHVVVEPHDLEIDIAAGRGVDAAVAHALSIGPTSRALQGESEAVRNAATADIRAAFARRALGKSVPLKAAIWIVMARTQDS